MKKTLNLVDELIEQVLSEQEWNKDSETPRDYSKEYNAPGSKEQDERNKRKRDKRKHDKEFGECPEGEELHHTNGVENDEMKCVSVSANRGRKEKSRLRDGEIVIRITEEHIRQIVQEETEEVLQEILPALAGVIAKGAALAGKGLAAGGRMAAKAGSAAAKQGAKVTKSLANQAANSLKKAASKKVQSVTQNMAKKISGTDVKSFSNLEDMINQVLDQASDEKLKGDPNKLIQTLQQSIPALKHLKTNPGAIVPGSRKSKDGIDISDCPDCREDDTPRDIMWKKKGPPKDMLTKGSKIDTKVDIGAAGLE